ncbi:hypothetical protein ACH5RR_005804 [Cinchona calisaya]|uniref:Uncharacterized protein n=1 Tax=Cinchona calisaya TaxID=153742 RepID=A0ABD3AM73_9GENT
MRDDGKVDKSSSDNRDDEENTKSEKGTNPLGGTNTKNCGKSGTREGNKGNEEEWMQIDENINLAGDDNTRAKRSINSNTKFSAENELINKENADNIVIHKPSKTWKSVVKAIGMRKPLEEVGNNLRIAKKGEARKSRSGITVMRGL